MRDEDKSSSPLFLTPPITYHFHHHWHSRPSSYMRTKIMQTKSSIDRGRKGEGEIVDWGQRSESGRGRGHISCSIRLCDRDVYVFVQVFCWHLCCKCRKTAREALVTGRGGKLFFGLLWLHLSTTKICDQQKARSNGRQILYVLLLLVEYSLFLLSCYCFFLPAVFRRTALWLQPVNNDPIERKRITSVTIENGKQNDRKELWRACSSPLSMRAKTK